MLMNSSTGLEAICGYGCSGYKQLVVTVVVVTESLPVQ